MPTLIKLINDERFMVDAELEQVIETFGRQEPLAPFDISDGRKVAIAGAAVAYIQDAVAPAGAR